MKATQKGFDVHLLRSYNGCSALTAVVGAKLEVDMQNANVRLGLLAHSALISALTIRADWDSDDVKEGHRRVAALMGTIPHDQARQIDIATKFRTKLNGVRSTIENVLNSMKGEQARKLEPGAARVWFALDTDNEFDDALNFARQASTKKNLTTDEVDYFVRFLISDDADWVHEQDHTDDRVIAALNFAELGASDFMLDALGNYIVTMGYDDRVDEFQRVAKRTLSAEDMETLVISALGDFGKMDHNPLDVMALARRITSTPSDRLIAHVLINNGDNDDFDEAIEPPSKKD